MNDEAKRLHIITYIPDVQIESGDLLPNRCFGRLSDPSLQNHLGTINRPSGTHTRNTVLILEGIEPQVADRMKMKNRVSLI